MIRRGLTCSMWVEYRGEVGFGSQHQIVVKCADALRAHSHL